MRVQKIGRVRAQVPFGAIRMEMAGARDEDAVGWVVADFAGLEDGDDGCCEDLVLGWSWVGG